MLSMKFLIKVLAVLSLFCTVESLECYVCTNQERNDDKCSRTINTCLVDQTNCLTKVSWKYPNYWTPGGQRIYSITKACDSNDDCDRKRRNNKMHCKRDWWNDWTCYDCCNGDRCNYYVTLGSVVTKPHIMMMSIAAVTALVRWFL